MLGLGLPAAALALSLHAGRQPSAAELKNLPASRATSGVPEVGALFANPASDEHNCTASVVDSPAGDLLLTAAHCVSGSAAGMMFAPGDRDGVVPYGRWIVSGVQLAPGWLKSQDPREDYAFLTVAPSRSTVARRRSSRSPAGIASARRRSADSVSP